MNMKRGALLALSLALMTAALAGALNLYWSRSTPVMTPVLIGPARTLVLDAGHGGEDGGAVSLTGAAESHINLELVEKLRDILAFYGVSPHLLREEDISLHDPSATTLRQKKNSDLKNRVAAVRELEDTVLLSIHQNSFSQEKYRGSQVFYGGAEGSQELAQSLQTAIKTNLQPDNDRKAKAMGEGVYLMEHVTCPAVLLECGFLTNREEEQLLRDPAYQRKLAAITAVTWLGWEP